MKVIYLYLPTHLVTYKVYIFQIFSPFGPPQLYGQEA